MESCVDLEAYMRLLESWYEILCFINDSSYIHYNWYVLLTSWKVVKFSQSCHAGLCVCVSEQQLGLFNCGLEIFFHMGSELWFINLVFRVQSKYVPYKHTVFINMQCRFSPETENSVLKYLGMP